MKEEFIKKQGFSILKAGTSVKYVESLDSVPFTHQTQGSESGNPSPSKENVNKANMTNNKSKFIEKTVKFASTLASVKEEGEDDDLERDDGPLDTQLKSSMKSQPIHVSPLQRTIDVILTET